MALDDLPDGERVAERLRHLLFAEIDEAVVNPVARERLMGGRLCLRDLTLVVREDEVLATPVDVEGVAEVAHRHRGALDVPPRTPGPPRTRPRRLVGLGRLPQREVARVSLALIDI